MYGAKRIIAAAAALICAAAFTVGCKKDSGSSDTQTQSTTAQPTTEAKKADITEQQLDELLKGLGDLDDEYTICYIGSDYNNKIISVGLRDMTKKDAILEQMKTKFDYFSEEYIEFMEGTPTVKAE